MTASIIDGKQIALQIRGEIESETRRFEARHGLVPGLAFVIVGDDPASQVYVGSKGKACAELGFHSVTHHLPESTSQEELLTLIAHLNSDQRIHGILIQLPLPPQIDSQTVIESIDYRKDVDGFHPQNVGRLVIGLPCLKPCTPSGVVELLVRSGFDPGGRHVVVVGRSNIVGKPVMNMLLQKHAGANAVVTIAHTGANDIASYTRQGDIVIAAIGKAEAIRGSMLKEGCVVIDVGINRIPDPSKKSGYRLAGDVEFSSASERAAAITPVPGGVGPMTIAMLMKNTLDAARMSVGDSP